MNKISEELIQASTAKVPTLNLIHFLLKTMSVLSSRSVETILFFVLDSSLLHLQLYPIVGWWGKAGI